MIRLRIKTSRCLLDIEWLLSLFFSFSSSFSFHIFCFSHYFMDDWLLRYALYAALAVCALLFYAFFFVRIRVSLSYSLEIEGGRRAKGEYTDHWKRCTLLSTFWEPSFSTKSKRRILLLTKQIWVCFANVLISRTCAN